MSHTPSNRIIVFRCVKHPTPVFFFKGQSLLDVLRSSKYTSVYYIQCVYLKNKLLFQNNPERLINNLTIHFNFFLSCSFSLHCHFVEGSLQDLKRSLKKCLIYKLANLTFKKNVSQVLKKLKEKAKKWF